MRELRGGGGAPQVADEEVAVPDHREQQHHRRARVARVLAVEARHLLLRLRAVVQLHHLLNHLADVRRVVRREPEGGLEVAD